MRKLLPILIVFLPLFFSCSLNPDYPLVLINPTVVTEPMKTLETVGTGIHRVATRVHFDLGIESPTASLVKFDRDRGLKTRVLISIVSVWNQTQGVDVTELVTPMFTGPVEALAGAGVPHYGLTDNDFVSGAEYNTFIGQLVGSGSITLELSVTAASADIEVADVLVVEIHGYFAVYSFSSRTNAPTFVPMSSGWTIVDAAYSVP